MMVNSWMEKIIDFDCATACAEREIWSAPIAGD
jgi:hypothetical protein